MPLNILSSKIDIDNETIAMPVPLRQQVIFYIFLLLDIPSVLCSLIIFYCFARLPELRQQIQSNQTIIYLLIATFLVNSIDMPLILPYLQNDYYIIPMKYPNSFCTFWIIYDYGFYSLNLWLMALFALERYLLIFHKELVMKNRKRRLLWYYVPVACIIIFVFSWFIYLVVFYPCTQMFDFTSVTCGVSCYQIFGSVLILNTHWIVFSLLPSFSTVLFTFILISHVLYQRHKINKRLIQQDTWKRTRKMFLQLLPVTFVFLLFNMPMIIVGILAISDQWYYTTPYFYANFLTYGWPLFLPFAILSNQNIIQKRILILLRLGQVNRNAVMIIATVPMRNMNIQTIGTTKPNTIKIDAV